jgi:hypothetical protein
MTELTFDDLMECSPPVAFAEGSAAWEVLIAQAVEFQHTVVSEMLDDAEPSPVPPLSSSADTGRPGRRIARAGRGHDGMAVDVA